LESGINVEDHTAVIKQPMSNKNTDRELGSAYINDVAHIPRPLWEKMFHWLYNAAMNGAAPNAQRRMQPSA